MLTGCVYLNLQSFKTLTFDLSPPKSSQFMCQLLSNCLHDISFIRLGQMLHLYSNIM